MHIRTLGGEVRFAPRLTVLAEIHARERTGREGCKRIVCPIEMALELRHAVDEGARKSSLHHGAKPRTRVLNLRSAV
jgi:hypothetical protein